MNQADLFGWGSPVERERRRRIRLTVWAYAYEITDAPLVSDDRFDSEARASDPTITTGRLDQWWRETFTPHSGQWIHHHPELPKVAALHQRLIYRPPQDAYLEGIMNRHAT